MWNRYGAEAVCLVVEHASLIEALSECELQLHIGVVVYPTDLAVFVQAHYRVNTLNLPFCKRAEFQHEQEVRVVHQHYTGVALGDHVWAAIDLRRLRAEIVMSPSGSSWELEDKVRDALHAAGLDWTVRRSCLALTHRAAVETTKSWTSQGARCLPLGCDE